MSLTPMFKKLINDSYELAQSITDPAKKAELYAQLALAIASTNLVQPMLTKEQLTSKTEEAIEEITEDVQKEAKKATKKVSRADLKRQPKEIPPEKIPTEEIPKVTTKPIKEEAVPENKVEEKAKSSEDKTKEEMDLTTWNDMTETKFAEELAYIQELHGECGEDVMNSAVKEFSNGVLNSLEDITPLNVVAFTSFCKQLVSAANE